MKKQLPLISFIILLTTLTTYGQQVQVGHTFTHNAIEYEITSITPGKEIKAIDYGGPGGVVTIPSTVNYEDVDYTVTVIGWQAFNHGKLTVVTIPSTVTSIDSFAFSNNQLENVEIPNGVISIGHSAFSRNQLTGVVIPSSVTSIGNWAFQGNNLTQVTFESPSNLTNIGWVAFRNNQLTQVTIPGNVTTIGRFAFANNPITTVIAQGTATVPSVVSHNTTINGFLIASFSNSHQIDVVVPQGKTEDYKAVGWTGFQSIKEGIEVSIDDTPGQKNDLAPFSVTITFNQDVTGFTQQDIADNLVNATVVDGSFSLVTGSTSTYTVELTPTVCEGIITIDIPGGVAEYAPNVSNLAASTTVTVNARPEAPTISSTNSPVCAGDNAIFTITGGTQGDVVTYEDGISTSPQMVTLGAGGSIEVTVSEVSSNTTLTLTNITRGNCSTPLTTTTTTTTTTATVTVNARPEAPSVNSASVQYCLGDQASPLTATGDNLLWYTSQAGGTGEATAPIPGTANAGSTTHYVSQTTNGCGESERAEIMVTVNELPSEPTLSPGNPVCAGEDAVFTITGTAGDVVTYDGTSSGTETIEADGTATVTVNGVNSDATLNLTAVSNGNCSIALADTATVTVNAFPLASAFAVSSNTPVCPGADAVFTITGTPGHVVTYDGTSSGTETIEAGGTATVTVSGVSSDVTLNLTGAANGNCSIALSGTATVGISTVSSTPMVNSPVAYCVGETATALTATGDNLLWYTSQAGGTGEATAPIPGTANAGSTTHYVSQTTNGCSESERAEIMVTVNELPSEEPTLSPGNPVCAGDDAVFTITGTPGHVVTYDGTSSGTETIEAGGTATVTVSAVSPGVTLNLTAVSNGNCSIALADTATVTVNANPLASAFAVSSNTPVCPGADAVFTITGTPGHVVTYDGTSSGTETIEAGGTATVTVSAVSADVTLNLTGATNGNCSIALSRTATVGISTISSTPMVNSHVAYCVGETATALTATGDNLLWYTSQAGGTGEATAPIPGTANAGTTSYYVSQTTNGCGESGRAEIMVTVNELPSEEPTLSPSNPVCAGEDAVFTITGTPGHVVTYDGTSSGRTIIEAGGTATVTVSGVSPGVTLNLIAVSNGNCSIALSGTATVMVNATPLASAFAVSSAVCAGEDVVFTITGTAGHVVTYDGTSSGTVAIEAGGTATVTVSRASPGVTLNLTEATNGDCSIALSGTATVTVNAFPLASAFAVSSNTPVCPGADAVFTITGTAGHVVTYDGTSSGTVTIEANGTATVTVSAVSPSVTLNLTGATNGNCSVALMGTATVMVNAIPSAPMVGSPVEYCVNETTTALMATGDNLLWYTSPTGGTGDATAPIPGTANAGSTSHYVSQTTNGCESDRAVIVVEVEACPAQIGDVFSVPGMEYQITSVNPNEVEIIDYIGSATAVEIPETVDDKDETYTVTALGANAFSDNPDLATVKIEATHLLSIHADAFADRSQVNLVVPTGMRQAYLENEWTGFASITEAQVVTAIHNYEFKDFTLYPNPARDKVYIDIDPRSGQELKQVNIYTMDRAYLHSENGPVINTARLPRGTYLFEIVTQKGDRSMKRVILQ